MSDERCPHSHGAGVEQYLAAMAANARMADTIATLRAELDEARAVMALCEWGGTCMSYGAHCPCCGNDQRQGHAPDCRLAKALHARGDGG